MILADSNEPENIVKLLKQSAPVVVSNLNLMHMSDYSFGNYEGKTFQFSRKQAGELAGNLDEAESQLVDYYGQADYNFQIVEGIMTPLPIKGIQVSDHSGGLSTRDIGSGRIFTYAVQPDGHIERGHSFSSVNLPILYAWIHRLAMAGIPTYWTANWQETAKLLVTIWRNEQKPPEEHMTLKRVIRPRLQARVVDPFTKSLMFISSAYKLGIGETKAEAISDNFANLLDVATCDESELASCKGIGKTIARKVLKAFGRSI